MENVPHGGGKRAGGWVLKVERLLYCRSSEEENAKKKTLTGFTIVSLRHSDQSAAIVVSSALIG